MAKKTNKINVVDVESTCWQGDPPLGQSSEIIQIGIAVVDVPSLTIERAKSVFCKTQASTVSEFCTELTGISQETLDAYGMRFFDACDVLRTDFQARNRIWASYGDYDRNQFQRCCDRSPAPQNKTSLDI